TDLLLGGETHYASLLGRDALERYDYTQLSPRITAELMAPDQIGVEIATRLPGIVYNTNYVAPADAPHTLAAALNPDWRRFMASTPTALNFDLPAGGEARATAISPTHRGRRCGASVRLVAPPL